MSAVSIAALLCPLAVAASVPPTSISLRNEITQRKSTSFEPLFQNWQDRYGTKAVSPLLQVVAAKGNNQSGTEDANRYIALMGAAKLGGKEAAPLFVDFLKDQSWMIRSGALRALAALKNPTTSQTVLPLLADPALVVRLEAVEAVNRLRPEGAAEALLATLENSANYHGGKAQWVPQKALLALSNLEDAARFAPRLKPLLEHQNDPELQKQTVATLETITGRSLKKGASLSERVREWKLALSKK